MPQRPRIPDPQSSAALPPEFVSRRSLTKRDLARELNVSIRTIDVWIHNKKIPYKKLGSRMVRFDLDQVEEALKRFTVKAVS